MAGNVIKGATTTLLAQLGVDPSLFGDGLCSQVQSNVTLQSKKIMFNIYHTIIFQMLLNVYVIFSYKMFVYFLSFLFALFVAFLDARVCILFSIVVNSFKD